jgi:hypothetical protein
MLHSEAKIVEHTRMDENTEVEHPWNLRRVDVVTKTSSFALWEEERLVLIAEA